MPRRRAAPARRRDAGRRSASRRAPTLRPPRGHRDRGLSAVVERVAQRPSEMRHLAAGDLARPDDAQRKRGQAQRRRDQKVVALEEPAECVDHRLTCRDGFHVIDHGQARRRFRIGDQLRIHPRLLLFRPRGMRAGLRAAVERAEDPARIADVGRRVVDLGPEMGEQACRVRDDVACFRFDGREAEIRRPRDAKRPGERQGRVARRDVVDGVVGEREWVAGVVARGRVHHQRDVAHGARERTHVRDQLVAAGGGIHRHAAERRLQADEPREARRDADRARAVGPERERRQTRRDCRGAASRRPSGRPREVPRIAGLAEQRVVGRAAPGELGQVRPADEDGARRAQARDAWRVFRRDEVGQQPRARRRALARRPEVVLDRHRHAVQRAEWRARHHGVLRASGFVERALGMDEHVGAELRVEALDLIQHRVRELDRRQRTLADQRRKLERRRKAQIVGHHRRSLSPRRRAVNG